MGLTSIEEQWRSYESKALNASAGDIQRRETRWAFFAGAYAMYWLLVGELPNLPDEEAAEAIAKYQEEFDAFYQQVLAFAKAAELAKALERRRD